MLCILHGYLLEGSGSNLWTRSVVESLCLDGHTVQLVCQEPYPDRYDCIAEAYRYHLDGRVETMFSRAVPYSGRCIMHKPQLGDTLPVYVWDKYDEYANVVPMINLADDEIEEYLSRNVAVVQRVVAERGVTGDACQPCGPDVGRRAACQRGDRRALRHHAARQRARVRGEARSALCARSRRAPSPTPAIFSCTARRCGIAWRAILPGVPRSRREVQRIAARRAYGAVRRPCRASGDARRWAVCSWSSHGLPRGRRPEQLSRMLDRCAAGARHRRRCAPCSRASSTRRKRRTKTSPRSSSRSTGSTMP